MASVAAQNFLDIDTIREDTVILKNGSLRVVLMCSSVNFALKSEEEQEAIIYQFQNFLNSLDFPIQFVIHSRKMNIAPYIESLNKRQKEEDNELLRIQINEYTEFIKTFVEMTNIMSKTFYVVVPFTPAIIETKKGFLGKLGFGKKTMSEEESFEQKKNQLWQRVETVIEDLHRLGIRAAPLNTEELIELFYGLYNPTEFEEISAQTRASLAKTEK